MPQLLLPGMPDGAMSINPAVSRLKKEGQVTWWVGQDNYFWHPATDHDSHRLAVVTLMANGHAKPCEISVALGIPTRTLQRWRRQLDERGSGSFHAPRAVRAEGVLTPEKITECQRLLATGLSIAATARRSGIKDSTLRKAIADGRVAKARPPTPAPTDAVATPAAYSAAATSAAAASAAPAPEACTKSERSRADAAAAKGLGTACTRADERIAATCGLAESATTRFEPGHDILLGGVLCGLPALCANGLFSGLDRYHRLPAGFYSALHILCVLGFMALARIRRPEQLRHHPPGELGKTLGLDRVPEVRTLREKVAHLATHGDPEAWMREVSKTWMQQDPAEAGYLYLDGHVRVYHGSQAHLPRRYVSRQKLCLRGTTDYWINDALGRPFFVVSKAVTDGLATTLLEDILPELLASVPGQPTPEQLEADPRLHRFVIVFDREGANHSLLSRLWEQRVAAITYRKAVTDTWPEAEFKETEVPVPGGGTTPMRLATRETRLGSANAAHPLPVQEVRRLTDTGHQTAIITTGLRLPGPAVAGRMFSRWSQENFFAYMMQHFDIDGLVEYGCEALPDSIEVVNPAWREHDKSLARLRTRLRVHQAKLGAAAEAALPEGLDIERRAKLLETLQTLQAQREELLEKRRATPRKIALKDLAESERPSQLKPLTKTLTDTVKMIAYRAETALVALLKRHLKTEEEARALIRELFVSSVDLAPDDAAKTLTIKVHRMATPAHDRAIESLLADLTSAEFRHPETGHLFIYRLV